MALWNLLFKPFKQYIEAQMSFHMVIDAADNWGLEGLKGLMQEIRYWIINLKMIFNH